MTLVTCSGFQLMQACLAALPFPHTPLLKWDRRQGCRYWARKGWSYFPLGEKQDPLYQSFKSIFFSQHHVYSCQSVAKYLRQANFSRKGVCLQFWMLKSELQARDHSSEQEAREAGVPHFSLRAEPPGTWRTPTRLHILEAQLHPRGITG